MVRDLDDALTVVTDADDHTFGFGGEGGWAVEECNYHFLLQWTWSGQRGPARWNVGWLGVDWGPGDIRERRFAFVTLVFRVWRRGPEFLVGLSKPRFGIEHFSDFEAVAVVQEKVCSLVGGSDIAAGVEEAGPCCVVATGEGNRMRIFWRKTACSAG